MPENISTPTPSPRPDEQPGPEPGHRLDGRARRRFRGRALRTRPVTGPAKVRRAHPRPAGLSADRDWEIADLVAVGVLDAVTGHPPVPISVWRATGPGEPPTTPGALFAGLTPRVAAILLAIYSDPGDLVLDATADPAVEGAAGAGGRRYRSLVPGWLATRPQNPQGDEQDPVPGHAPTGRRNTGTSTRTSTGTGAGASTGTGAGVGAGTGAGAGLVLLRWPGAGGAGGAEAGPGSLEACARLLAPDGHAVTILAPPAGGFYRDHARAVIASAARAGLGYLQHIVVITSDTADDDTADDSAGETGADTGGRDVNAGSGHSSPDAGRQHLDLLVLVLRLAPEPGNGPASGAGPVPGPHSGPGTSLGGRR